MATVKIYQEGNNLVILPQGETVIQPVSLSAFERIEVKGAANDEIHLISRTAKVPDQIFKYTDLRNEADGTYASANLASEYLSSFLFF